MRKYLPIIAILAAIKLCVHLVGNRNYGFHRDELLHLSVGQHLAFGYMEFPPLIAWIGKLSHLIFGYSLSGTRIFATLAGIAILVLCCLMAKELGGRRYAVLLAGVSILSFLPYYRNHMLFQPVAFDQLFWILGFYFLIKYINTQKNRFLVYLGIAAGFGLLNKYTFLVWGVGIVIGLLFYQKARLFTSKWLFASGIIAFVVFLPNAIWQYEHNFPVLLHLQKLKESQLDAIAPYDFVVDQVMFPFTLTLSVLGLYVLLVKKRFREYRCVGISVIVIFATMWFMQSKGYYFYAIYPVLFAAGSVAIEKILETRPRWNYAIAFVLVSPVFFYLPKAIPVLPVVDHLAYENIKPDDSGRYKLPDDYADMFGWNEQVKSIDSVYEGLSVVDQEKCVLLASNYGEAGAIKVLGKHYGLPDPVCASGSFWLWGPGNKNADVAIAIGLERQVLNGLFAEIQLIKVIRHPYAIEEEHNVELYLCRKPKMDIRKIWPTLERHVFD